MKAFLSIILFCLLAPAALSEAQPQTLCPVDKKKINPALYADLNGYRFFACSSDCIKYIRMNGLIIYKRLQADKIDIQRSPNQPDGISGASKKKKRKSK